MTEMNEQEKNLVEWLADMREEEALALANKMLLEEDASPLRVLELCRMAMDIVGAILEIGDFNATLDHVPLRRLLAFGLRDAAEATNAGWQPTYPAPGSTTWLGLPVPPLVPIDRVLFSGGLAVSHMWRVTTAGADHVGVVADVHPVRAPS